MLLLCFPAPSNILRAPSRFTPPPTPPKPLPNHNSNSKLLVSAEIELNTKCVVEMEDNQTVLHPPPSNGKGENR